ncbi:DNA mismatch repair endonuclease MutL [Fructilactobacillus florum]|uniref:DNA mismatch repair protein MutL n=1 Tax=Fructilactobacillus florum DSM 22689 = JCM 16035 TaxID=1423745 RepID=A0A0R2CX84_9LACO|nr:DNA mismatch repair endonuclease MutL [Fructilactobacillus florum]EKK20909.1 DNA mismatch repair protein MutL [Fructilactobacillus florum 2F]KRM92422.1 DNA mismatch repair protein mutL [Fructilactobacillus florum DSM 22689 = JCM 16035]
MVTAIHELSTRLADQISAGEVIERPASVVKELVENSIDAQSTKIDVVIEDTNHQVIKVIDNGTGIVPEQVELAFRRYATSKISQSEDLTRIHSLGFRGEALPSIASIAKVTMQTSDGIHPGVQLQVMGGQLGTKQPAASRRGTTVVVSDLFYNTPHRRRYLKSANTELAKITETINQLALGHPQIAISLRHNQKEVLQTAGRGNLQQVIGGIYNNQILKQLLAVDRSTDDFIVHGYIGKPELTRASRNYISLIINGRYVRNADLSKAVIAGYGSKLMVGRFPMVILELTIDPSRLDVNVQPTKQAVRLLDHQELGLFLTETISQRLQKQNLIPQALDNKVVRTTVSAHNQMEVALNLTEATPPIAQLPATPQPDQPVKSTQRSVVGAPILVKTSDDLQQPAVRAFQQRYAQEPAGAPFENQPTALKTFPSLRYLAQVHGTYLVAEGDEGLYLIDQHAAQERINYERLRVAVGKVENSEQPLLVPLIFDYSAAEALTIQQNLATLASIGLQLEPFGSNSFVVHQHPTWIKAGQEESTIRELIDWVLVHRQVSIADFREQTAIMASCKQAIKANHHLDQKQAVALLQRLAQCENPYNCPHGRPVLVHFSNTDLETMFKRIQDTHDSKESEF